MGYSPTRTRSHMLKSLIAGYIALGIISCTTVTPTNVDMTQSIHSLTYKPFNRISPKFKSPATDKEIYHPVYKGEKDKDLTKQAWIKSLANL